MCKSDLPITVLENQTTTNVQKGELVDYLRVHNWDKWQSYRADRGQPPWIKVHRQVMRHIEWVAMNDSERGQLVSIWLLAADHNGVIPASPDIIQKLCFLSSPPDIERFILLGFVDKKPVKRDQISHYDDTLTPQRPQDDQPKAEKSREEKRRVEKVSKRFSPPSLEEVKSYCLERKNTVDPEKWINHYQSKGWMIGKNKMKDWKAAVRTWEDGTVVDTTPPVKNARIM